MENEKKRAKVHAVVVQKGGVGKTTVTANLGLVFAQAGYKVLLIDHDSQASLTGICNVNLNDPNGVYGIVDLYNDLMERKIPQGKEDLIPYIKTPSFPTTTKIKGVPKTALKKFGFDLIPADIMLAEMEISLAQNRKHSGMYLNAVIELINRYMDYDYIFIDCAPGLTLGSYNAIGASIDGVIIPCNLETMTLRGVENLISKVAEAQRSLKKIVHKGILGIVMNQYSERRRVDKAIESEIKRFIPLKVFDTSIPESTQCKTATYLGLMYCQKYKKAEDSFVSLMKEIIKTDKERENETESLIVEVFGEKYEQLHRNEIYSENIDLDNDINDINNDEDIYQKDIDFNFYCERKDGLYIPDEDMIIYDK